MLLQIADVIFRPLGVPNWVMVALVASAVIGLPARMNYETQDLGMGELWYKDTRADETRRDGKVTLRGNGARAKEPARAAATKRQADE